MAMPAAVKDALQVDAGRLTLTAPLRTTLVVMVIVGVTQATGRIEMGIIMSIGALFTGIADPSDANWPRLRTMVAVAWWCSLAALLGVAVANSSWFHLIAAFVVAGACGYVGVLGPRAVLGGTLTLVVFVVYAGSPPKLYTPLEIGALTAAGGAAFIVVAVVPWILSRHSGVRGAAATAYRNLSLAAAGTIATTSTSIADACGAARSAAMAMPHSLRLQAWLVHLAELSQQTRLGLIALDHAQNQAAQPSDAVNVMRSDVTRLSRQIARAVVWPVRSRALATGIERLEQSRQVVIDEGTVEPVLVMAATGPLVDAARQVAAVWPHGRVGQDSPTDANAASDTATQALAPAHQGLWLRLAPRGRFANHAVRLAVAVTLATALTTFGDFPHEYWLPMTVAWMARPDLGGTLSRVGLRVVGTIVGVTVSALILSVFTPGTVGITLLVGVATLLAAVFIFANYAIAVVGITMFVLILFSTSGESVSEDVVLRTAATMLAGVITLAIAFVRPERQADRLVSVLASTANALHTYARATAASLVPAPPSASLSANKIDDARAQLLVARSNAQTTLTAAEHEPGGHGIAVGAGRELLSAMVDTAAEIFTIELLHPSVTGAISTAATPTTTPATTVSTAGLRSRHVDSAHDLHQRLVTFDETGSVLLRSVPASHSTALDRHLDRAHRVLDELLGTPATSPTCDSPPAPAD